MELQPSDPSHIGEYRLIGRLGSGGFGIVYQAEDPAGNDVALKLLRSEVAEDPEAYKTRSDRSKARKVAWAAIAAHKAVGDLANANAIARAWGWNEVR